MQEITCRGFIGAGITTAVSAGPLWQAAIMVVARRSETKKLRVAGDYW